MSKTKRFIMQVSQEMGHGGDIIDTVLKEAGRRMKAGHTQMCEGCGEKLATHDFLCDTCHESMQVAYGDPVEYTANELDEMEREWYSRREQENGYKHHNGPEGLE